MCDEQRTIRRKSQSHVDRCVRHSRGALDFVERVWAVPVALSAHVGISMGYPFFLYNKQAKPKRRPTGRPAATGREAHAGTTARAQLRSQTKDCEEPAHAQPFISPPFHVVSVL